MPKKILHTVQGHMGLQVAATLFQFSGQIEAVLPQRWALLVHAIVSAAQILLAGWNHFKNPDGTPAALPYTSADSNEK